jgi:hypothetical protein
MRTKLTAIVLAATLLLVGCLSQASIAALVNTLGNASAALAGLEGNTDLAQKLRTDTAAAVAAVNNWQKGTPAQMVIEALGIVEDDLNLIPFAGPYIPLISLALVTVQEIVTIVTQNSPTPAPPVARKGARQVIYTGKIPKTDGQFKSAWNKVVAANPQLAPVAIK